MSIRVILGAVAAPGNFDDTTYRQQLYLLTAVGIIDKCF